MNLRRPLRFWLLFLFYACVGGAGLWIDKNEEKLTDEGRKRAQQVRDVASQFEPETLFETYRYEFIGVQYRWGSCDQWRSKAEVDAENEKISALADAQDAKDREEKANNLKLQLLHTECLQREEQHAHDCKSSCPFAGNTDSDNPLSNNWKRRCEECDRLNNSSTFPWTPFGPRTPYAPSDARQKSYNFSYLCGVAPLEPFPVFRQRPQRIEGDRACTRFNTSDQICFRCGALGVSPFTALPIALTATYMTLKKTILGSSLFDNLMIFLSAVLVVVSFLAVFRAIVPDRKDTPHSFQLLSILAILFLPATALVSLAGKFALFGLSWGMDFTAAKLTYVLFVSAVISIVTSSWEKAGRYYKHDDR